MKLVISRYWHNPTISITVGTEGIELETSLEDVVKAVIAEIGSPLMITNTTQLEKKAIIALDTVVRKIKEASTQAIV
jgi:hypothetical protein